MIELIDLDFNKEEDTVRAKFNGVIKGGFIVTSEVDYDEIIGETRDESSGLMETKSVFEHFSFWYFKIVDANNKQVNFDDNIIDEIKQEIQTKIIG